MSADEPTVRLTEFQPATTPHRPFLVVVAGASAGDAREIADRPLLLGRAEDADLRLPDAGVSSRHCRVFRVATLVFVEDLGSTNDVFVDDVRVQGTAAVPLGATLRAGPAVVRLELRDPAEVRRDAEISQELARAADYVRSLLPAPVAAGPLRLDWRFVPSLQLGGDAFGYHELSPGRTALYLLDCCGHGARAALHAVSVMNVLRGRALPGVDFGRPSAVLEALCDVFPMEQHGGMYFTAWYGTYDAAAHRLTWACAGNPPPLLLRRDGTSESLGGRGLAIGLGPFRAFEERAAALAPGDRVCLFSDGVFEVTLSDGSAWTRRAFESVVADLAHAVPLRAEGIEAAVRPLMRGGFDDDVSLLVAEVAA